MKRIFGFVMSVLLVVCAGCSSVKEQKLGAEDLFFNADRLMLEGKYEEAILQYDMILEISPKDEQAYLKLSKVYEQLGDMEKAIATLEGAVSQLTVNEGSEIWVHLKELRSDYAEKLYKAYLLDALIPQYGLADLKTIETLYVSDQILGTDDRCLGIVTALRQDMDNDGMDELLAFVCEPYTYGGYYGGITHVLKLHAYSCTDGNVKRLPGCEDYIFFSLESTEFSVIMGYAAKIDLFVGEQPFLYFYRSGGGGDCNEYEHCAFIVQDRKLQQVMNAVECDSGWGEWGLATEMLPPWLEAELAEKELIKLDDAYYTGYTLLYTDLDDIEDAYYDRFPGEYKELYSSRDAALAALLKPIEAAEEIKPVYAHMFFDSTNSAGTKEYQDMRGWLHIV